MQPCVICEQPFENRKHPKALACSKTCAGALSWRNRVAKGERPGRNYPVLTCRMCRTEFRAKYYHPLQKTCSPSCAAKLRQANNPRHRVKWTAFQRLVAWKQGIPTKEGYIPVYIPEHPRAQGKGRVMEHRLVMEQHLGRFLEKNEVVHHRNGVKADNRIENLEIVTHARPNGWVLCPHCRQSFQVH